MSVLFSTLATSFLKHTYWTELLNDMLTPEELALVSSRTPFELKHQATEKLKDLMQRVRHALLAELEPEHILCPEQTDFVRGQIAKGENYEGYPYVMLDFPKHFGKTDIFTYRTMFWYGHYFIFSLLLAGTHLSTYLERLDKHFDTFSTAGFFAAKADLWDWRPDAFERLDSARKSEILMQLRTLPFLKLAKLLAPSILSDESAVLSGARSFYRLTTLLTAKP